MWIEESKLYVITFVLLARRLVCTPTGRLLPSHKSKKSAHVMPFSKIPPPVSSALDLAAEQQLLQTSQTQRSNSLSPPSRSVTIRKRKLLSILEHAIAVLAEDDEDCDDNIISIDTIDRGHSRHHPDDAHSE